MKTFFRLCCVFALLLCVNLFGFSHSEETMLRGGIGFLFPDANSFANAGQMAYTNGTGVEGYYTKQNLSQSQELTGSAVWGDGHFGLGAFADRAGTDLGSNKDAVDTVGASMGLGLMHDSVTVGVGATHVTSAHPPADGTVNASINYNGMGRRGFTLGAGGGTTISSKTKNVQNAEGGIGWGFGNNTSIEADYTLPDTSNTKDYIVSGVVTAGNQIFYFSGAYDYLKEPSLGLNTSEVEARLGMMLCRNIDFSAHAEKILLTGYEPTYGGSFRVSF